MPRNIEYLLETYIQEDNLPLFILICAVDNGFYPPSELLKSFGRVYGQDNSILSKEQIIKSKLNIENELKKLLSPPHIDLQN